MNTFRETCHSAGLVPARSSIGTPEQRELIRIAVELVLADAEQLLMHDSFVAGANGNAQGLAAAAGRVRAMSATNSLVKGSRYVESVIDSVIERAANPTGGAR